MSDIVTALYESRDEAARALASLRAEVPLSYADIYNPTAASALALQKLNLTAEERAACEEKLITGDYLLLAQPPTGEGPENIIAVLERVAAEPVDEPHSGIAIDQPGMLGSGSPIVSEERVPIVEQELHVGTRTVVRGGATVRARVDDAPVVQEVDLVSEFVRIASRPASRRVSDEEVQQGGLLRDRMFEIAQFRQEAVVNKEVVIREEIIVSKTIEHRVEPVSDTVRRTVVEAEYLGADAAGQRGQP